MAAQASRLPRVRVAAVIRRDDGIVVVRHRRGEQRYHLLPGGGVEHGETLETALVREVREETGLEVRLGQPLFVNDTVSPDGRRHVVNITFVCEVTGGEMLRRPADRVIEAVEVVGIDRLKELDLRPAIVEELVAAVRSGFECSTRYLGAIWTPEAGTPDA